MTDADNTELRDAVAIDGPAGSGKSSVARALAVALGYLYIDTGAMYRAVAYQAMREGADLLDEGEMARIAEDADISFDGTGSRVLLDGCDISREIRTLEVTENVKYAARVTAVRERLRALQQAMCERRPVVMEGRDITTVVLPRARWKFFLTASPEIRATRRHAELLAAGRDVDYGSILADINRRDSLDYEVGPMKEARDRARAHDGIHYLDTSGMGPEAVVRQLLHIINHGE